MADSVLPAGCPEDASRSDTEETELVEVVATATPPSDAPDDHVVDEPQHTYPDAKLRRNMYILNGSMLLVAALLMGLAAAIMQPSLFRPSLAPTCTELAGHLYTTERHEAWHRLGCDEELAVHAQEVVSVVRGRPAYHRVLSSRTDGRPRPVIGVGVAVSSKGVASFHIAEHPICDALLSSLLATIESGFDYWIYIVHDSDDAVYSSSAMQDALRSWFEEMSTPVASQLGVELQLVIMPFANRLRKPGPAMNVAMHAAYEDGADYLFRVNDDTRLTTKWASTLTRALGAMSPPNVGVVGPVTLGAPNRILTHDMTHRTHLDVFDTYYPPMLSGWWMDDWITTVYGGLTRQEFLREADIDRQRLLVQQSLGRVNATAYAGVRFHIMHAPKSLSRAQLILSARVEHGSVGRRYQVHANTRMWLDQYVWEGMVRLTKWLEAKYEETGDPVYDTGAKDMEALAHIAHTRLLQCAVSKSARCKHLV